MKIYISAEKKDRYFHKLQMEEKHKANKQTKTKRNKHKARWAPGSGIRAGLSLTG